MAYGAYNTQKTDVASLYYFRAYVDAICAAAVSFRGVCAFSVRLGFESTGKCFI